MESRAASLRQIAGRRSYLGGSDARIIMGGDGPALLRLWQEKRGQAARKVSLRSSDGEADVSAIARKNGGGGHKRAAGFSTDLEIEELIAFLCDELVDQLG